MLSTFARASENGARHVLALSSLPDEKDKRSALEAVINTVGKLWTAGVGIDWSFFHENEKRRRLPLPTYPFERQRYWVEFAPEKIIANPTSVEQMDVAKWFYVPAWTRTPAPEINSLDDVPEWAKTILLFKDALGLGAELASELRAWGRNVVEVVPGSGYANDGQNYAIDPLNWGNYLKLISGIEGRRLNAGLYRAWLDLYPRVYKTRFS